MRYAARLTVDERELVDAYRAMKRHEWQVLYALVPVRDELLAGPRIPVSRLTKAMTDAARRVLEAELARAEPRYGAHTEGEP